MIIFFHPLVVTLPIFFTLSVLMDLQINFRVSETRKHKFRGVYSTPYVSAGSRAHSRRSRPWLLLGKDARGGDLASTPPEVGAHGLASRRCNTGWAPGPHFPESSGVSAALSVSTDLSSLRRRSLWTSRSGHLHHELLNLLVWEAQSHPASARPTHPPPLYLQNYILQTPLRPLPSSFTLAPQRVALTYRSTSARWVPPVRLVGGAVSLPVWVLLMLLRLVPPASASGLAACAQRSVSAL